MQGVQSVTDSLRTLPLHTWWPSVVRVDMSVAVPGHRSSSHRYLVLLIFEVMDKRVLQRPPATIRSFMMWSFNKKRTYKMGECISRLLLFPSLNDTEASIEIHWT